MQSASDILRKIFKAPNYLKMPAAAFDLSDGSIKFMQAKEVSGTGLVPDLYEFKPIEPGIIKEGEIINKERLTEELAYFRTKYPKFKFVNMALPEESAFVFDLKMKNSELENSNQRQLIEFKLTEFIPFNPENAIFDFDIIKQNDGYLHVSVLVYPKDTVEEYLSAFERAGYTVKHAELETASIARACVPESAQKESYIVLDVGASKVGITLFVNSVPFITSAVNLPLQSIFEEIYKKKIPNKKFSKEEFYEWKFQEGILFADPEELAELDDIIIKKLSKIISFFDKSKAADMPKVQKIYLSGGNSATKALDLYFEERLGIETLFANSWERSFSLNKRLPKINKKDSFQFATLAGLLLKDVYG